MIFSVTVGRYAVVLRRCINKLKYVNLRRINFSDSNVYLALLAICKHVLLLEWILGKLGWKL